MKMNELHLILASGSPRRRQLLTEMGFEFEIMIPDVDENVEGAAREVTAILSRRKAEAIGDTVTTGLIIASDTLVSLNGKALGKPADPEDAFRMLRELSGRAHQVYTGVTIIDAATGKNETRVVRTDVHFRDLTDEEIREYIASGEPMDKAGAYAIQGGAGAYVNGLEGSMENVIGFPTQDIREMLEHFIEE